MSFERAHQKSAQSNHGLTLIGAHDQNCLDRKLTKIEVLFSNWNMTVWNSKSDLYRSNWRSTSHEPLHQISGRSAHRWSRIGPLMKYGQWKKNRVFLSNFKKWWFSHSLYFLLLLSFFSTSGDCKKNWRKKKKRDSSSNPFI